jgi:hypothetical protein
MRPSAMMGEDWNRRTIVQYLEAGNFFDPQIRAGDSSVFGFNPCMDLRMVWRGLHFHVHLIGKSIGLHWRSYIRSIECRSLAHIALPRLRQFNQYDHPLLINPAVPYRQSWIAGPPSSPLAPIIL